MHPTDWVKLGDDRASFRSLFVLNVVVAALRAYEHDPWCLAWGLFACIYLAIWRKVAGRIQAELTEVE